MVGKQTSVGSCIPLCCAMVDRDLREIASVRRMYFLLAPEDIPEGIGWLALEINGDTR
jgi:hypothetical protein